VSSFIESLSHAMAEVFIPLKSGLASKEEAEALLFRLGWDVDFDNTQIDAIRTAFDISPQLESTFDRLEDLFYADAEQGVLASLELLESIKALVDRLRTLSPTNLSSLPAPFDQASAWSDLSDSLFPDLLASYLKDNQPAIFAFLHLAGAISFNHQSPGGAGRVDYVKTEIDWEILANSLVRPDESFRNRFNWNTDTGDFDHQGFLQVLERVLHAFRVPAGVGPPRPVLADALLHDNSVLLDNVDEIEIPIVDGVSPDDGSYWNIGAVIVPIAAPAKSANKPSGIAFVPLLQGELAQSVRFGHDIELRLIGGFEVDNNLRIHIHPDSVNVDSDLASTTIDAAMEIVGAPEKSWLLIGDSDNSRLELDGFYIGYQLRGAMSDLESVLSLGTTEPDSDPRKAFRVVIDLSDDGDSFASSLAGEKAISVEASLTMAWSSKYGFTFQGTASFESVIPIHRHFGSVQIHALYLSVGAGMEDSRQFAKADAGIAVAVNLGPLTAVIDNIGVRTAIVPKDNTDESGSLGNGDLKFGFKPPNGVGLSLDAGTVKGGGYLFFDFDREEYAGALELVFSEWITLKAVGLITTKLPDGSKGFSLLIIVTAEFDSGFQLGLGFTLRAVGGLLGLNRIANIDPLKEGIRTGAIESVMFPEDVIANAPRIISDLRRFFPPQQAIFLVGPLAKIGWGTPALVNAQLGLILEFPSVNITILGVIKVVLPDEEADVLRLQVNFIGRFEPSNKLLWFYAELFDSRVLNITLEGGFGLLVNWGDNANFVVSVGGFYPRYNPPPLPFLEPSRIAASILNESYAMVRIEGYFAVTSNSVQFGARAELFFGASKFKIEGFLNFDALFQFDPFYFSFSLSISLSVKVFGVGLFSVGFSGLLEGPTPWHIEGKGRIKILFFINISVPFEHAWGDNQDTKLDPIAVYPLLEAEFNALTNWEAKVPDNSNLLVSLRKLEESDRDQLVLHPVGKLRISQRKVPVNFKLDKIGNQRPLDFDQLEVNATLSGGESLSVSKTTEKFAIGQFKDLDGSSQLSSPAFEPLESGIEIRVAGEQMRTSRAVRRVIRYETIIIDNNFKRRVKTFFGFFNAGYAVLNDFLFAHFLKGSAVSQSVLSKHQKQRMQPYDEVVQLKPNQYSVAFNTNNRPLDAVATTFTSQAKAFDYMERQIQNDSGLANRLHVIPNTELNIAA
jgi:hypothetical protein